MAPKSRVSSSAAPIDRLAAVLPSDVPSGVPVPLVPSLPRNEPAEIPSENPDASFLDRTEHTTEAQSHELETITDDLGTLRNGPIGVPHPIEGDDAQDEHEDHPLPPAAKDDVLHRLERLQSARDHGEIDDATYRTELKTLIEESLLTDSEIISALEDMTAHASIHSTKTERLSRGLPASEAGPTPSERFVTLAKARLTGEISEAEYEREMKAVVIAALPDESELGEALAKLVTTDPLRRALGEFLSVIHTDPPESEAPPDEGPFSSPEHTPPFKPTLTDFGIVEPADDLLEQKPYFPHFHSPFETTPENDIEQLPGASKALGSCFLKIDERFSEIYQSHNHGFDQNQAHQLTAVILASARFRIGRAILADENALADLRHIPIPNVKSATIGKDLAYRHAQTRKPIYGSPAEIDELEAARHHLHELINLSPWPDLDAIREWTLGPHDPSPREDRPNVRATGDQSWSADAIIDVFQQIMNACRQLRDWRHDFELTSDEYAAFTALRQSGVEIGRLIVANRDLIHAVQRIWNSESILADLTKVLCPTTTPSADITHKHPLSSAQESERQIAELHRRQAGLLSILRSSDPDIDLIADMTQEHEAPHRPTPIATGTASEKDQMNNAPVPEQDHPSALKTVALFGLFSAALGALVAHWIGF